LYLPEKPSAIKVIEGATCAVLFQKARTVGLVNFEEALQPQLERERRFDEEKQEMMLDANKAQEKGLAIPQFDSKIKDVCVPF